MKQYTVVVHLCNGDNAVFYGMVAGSAKGAASSARKAYQNENEPVQVKKVAVFQGGKLLLTLEVMS